MRMKGISSALPILVVAAVLLFGIVGMTQSVMVAPMSVTATKITAPYSVGSVFTYTFKLENTATKTLPETTATSKDSIWTAYFVRDSANNVALQSQLTEVSTPVLKGGTVDVPVSYSVNASSPNGKYIAGAVLVEIPQVYDADTGKWTQGVEKVLDKQAVEFTVAGTNINPPVWNFLQSLFDAVAGFFNALFGR